MNPQFSVVFLTTASGAGYGMLMLLGVLNALRLLPQGPWFGVVATLVALALSAAGLIASLFHLGHPERAWRAISQWRTSWLSREGVLSLLTNLPAIGFAASWGIAGSGSIATLILGLLAALCALLTVISQAMIYASLKPVRQWRNGLVLPFFILAALSTGAAWLAALGALWNASATRPAMAIAIVAAIVALLTKVAYWRHIDTAPAIATIESATGLGSIGPVRSLESPHTEENYLLREMGFAIARKHAARLRRIALLAAFVIPAILLLIAIAWHSVAGIVILVLAAPVALVGMYVERWLFFAQATHTVTLYYGGTSAR